MTKVCAREARLSAFQVAMSSACHLWQTRPLNTLWPDLLAVLKVPHRSRKIIKLHVSLHPLSVDIHDMQMILKGWERADVLQEKILYSNLLLVIC